MRKGNWMQTATGGQYWPIDPRPEDVKLGDIARSLSMQCRFNGHVRNFYSVAQHSVLVSHEVPPLAALAGLLHDAPEAYCCDVPSPLKPYLEGYAEIEERNREVIFEAFGVLWTSEIEEQISHVDKRIIGNEREAILAPCAAPWPPTGWLVIPEIEPWGPSRAEAEFCKRFHELTGGKFG